MMSKTKGLFKNSNLSQNLTEIIITSHGNLIINLVIYCIDNINEIEKNEK